MTAMAPHDRASVPEKSSIAIVSPDALGSDVLQGLLAIWNERRAERLMPARSDFSPRAIGQLLKYVSLVRVMSGGDDYEFRIIGDVHVQAYGTRHQGKCLSEVMNEAQGFGRALKKSFDVVVRSRGPIAYSGVIGRDAGEARFVALESLFLPLGDDDDRVDHIVTAGVYVPRRGYWPDETTGA